MMLFTLSFLTMKFTMENHAHQCGVVIGFSLLWCVLAFFSIYTVNRAEPVRAKFNLRAGRSPKRSTRIQIKKKSTNKIQQQRPISSVYGGFLKWGYP
jgi:hypothetical protein